MLRTKDKLGSYEIVASLKAGGMAEVYLARRKGAAGFTRPVALKLIHPHLAAEPEFVRMFVDEASLSAKIEAPNVVHVEELGQIDGVWFQAMEYVHGASLAQVIRALRAAGRRCSPALAAHVIAEIAAGLHAAHETTDGGGVPLGIVHRDVSPHNVLVSYRGNVKVCDFGIAKAMRRANAPQTDAIRGKLAYMAPEQAHGREVDRRADIYSLGIVLWELLVLERPFDAASDIALLEKARNPVIAKPSARVSDIPPALDDVVMAALALRPEDRPPTAAELRRLVLDAVPSARQVESDDVAALLRAVMSAEIEAQAKLLPLVSESTIHLELSPLRPHEARPDDALRHLTLPAVVLPKPSSRSVSETAPASRLEGRARNGTLLVGIGLAAVLVAAMAMRIATSAYAPAAAVAMPAMESNEGEARQLSPILPGVAASNEDAQVVTAPAVPTLGVASALPSPAVTSPTVSATAHRRAAPRPSPRPAVSAARPVCRKVGGVELCE